MSTQKSFHAFAVFFQVYQPLLVSKLKLKVYTRGGGVVGVETFDINRTEDCSTIQLKTAKVGVPHMT